jgi:pimeloyl-ACP methyl ester carboxylesterase
MPSAPKRSSSPRPAPSPSSPEVVDPVWVAKALGITVVVAAVCGYITLCGLFYLGQWQLALSPSRSVTHTPSDIHLAFNEVHFGTDASGQPQLHGWWIPADLPSDPTVLMLHAGNGSISDALPQARALHDARLNVLLFDYRGFGQSKGQHPTQALMQQDSEAAFSYLTTMRQIAPASIIVYGEGVGASLAAKLCGEHREISAIILNNPDGDLTSRARSDSRARMAPVGLLFHEDFPLAAPLHTLATAKLLIIHADSKVQTANLQQAAYPKMTVVRPGGNGDEALHESLRRFLDEYVAHSPQLLKPAH